jgi:lysophospholipase L1-like esterase
VKKPGEEIVKLNAMLQDYAKKNKITYVDYHSAMKDNENGLPKSLAHDGCHPTIEGYKIMEEIVLKVLK